MFNNQGAGGFYVINQANGHCEIVVYYLSFDSHFTFLMKIT